MNHYYPQATHSEAMQEFALNVGREAPSEAWILTPYDVWVSNPFYTGAPQPHPEDQEVQS